MLPKFATLQVEDDIQLRVEFIKHLISNGYNANGVEEAVDILMSIAYKGAYAHQEAVQDGKIT